MEVKVPMHAKSKTENRTFQFRVCGVFWNIPQRCNLRKLSSIMKIPPYFIFLDVPYIAFLYSCRSVDAIPYGLNQFGGEGYIIFFPYF